MERVKGSLRMTEQDAFDLWWEWAEKAARQHADDSGRAARRGDGAFAAVITRIAPAT